MKISRKISIEIYITICVIFSLATIAVVFGGLINRQDLSQLSLWFIDFKVQFFLNVSLIFFLILILSTILNSVGFGGIIGGGIYIIISSINYYKDFLKGEYLSPQDFKLFKESLTIIREFDLEINSIIIYCILIYISLCLLLINLKFEIKNRNIFLMLIMSSVFFIIHSIYLDDNMLGNMGVEKNIFFDRENYTENGLALTLVMKIQDMIIEKPDLYSSKEVQRIYNKYYTNSRNHNNIPNIKPNIVMIMNEAFFDITEINNLEITEDPLANFHKYQNENIQGDIISSVFGGLTAQTEYEILTGNSVDFIGADNVAYMNYVHTDADSIVKVLKNEGYETLAIHPYSKSFYKRDIVYNKLGFEKFVSQEEMVVDSENAKYISDMDTYKHFIDEYERRDSKKPVFTQIVTMQNHAPYESNLEKRYVTNENITKDSLSQVEGYIDNIKKSDDALKYLIEYFRNINDPTMIIFYGDHAPVLGDFYTEVSFGKKEIDRYKLHKVPLLIWKNYETERRDLGIVDTSYISSLILDMIGIDDYPYYEIVEEMMLEIKALNSNFIIDKDNQYVSIGDITNEQRNMMDNLWILQYDRIFGENYLERNFG